MRSGRLSIVSDVIIVGGGVIGLSLARELHRMGHQRIAVIDRGEPGREASWAAAGMLTPNIECEAVDDFYHLCETSRRMFPRLAEELLAETGVDIELDRAGTLFPAFTDDDAEHLDRTYLRQTAAGIPVERLSRRDVRAAEPRLAENVRDSLFFPHDWQVENRLLVHALERFTDLNGITLIPRSPVDSLIVEGDRVTGVSCGTECIPAGVVVIATGAWTSLIKVGNRPMPLTVKPIRGQIISFAPAERLFAHVIHSRRGYLVPRADGRILIGATVEEAGFDRSTTIAAENQLAEAASEFSPVFDGLPISGSWAGLRPYAEGGMPIIGEVPGWSNLFVGTAHYRNGILLAPITARVLARQILRVSDESNFGSSAAMGRP